MGTYLATGIVHKISISKKETKNRKVPLENIAHSLQKEISLTHYTFTEDDGTLCWEIKSEMLEGNLAEFLQAQFKMYNETEDISELLARLRQAKTAREIIGLAEARTFSGFQMVDNILDSVKVLRENGFSDYATVSYELMAFFIDGKIIMECYDNILHYFERAIRIQEPEYPVAACLKTMITS